MVKENHRTIIVEPNSSGHRFFYVSLLVRAAVHRNDRVWVCTTTSSVDSDEWRTHLEPLAGSFTLVEADSFGVPELAELSRQFDADVTVVPDGDGIIRQLALPRSWRGSGTLNVLVMRPKAQGSPGFGRAARTLAKGLLRTMARARNVRVRVLESALSVAKASRHAVRDPVEISATPDDARELRVTWGLDASRYWFAVLGAITPRKNVSMVLEAASAVTSGPVGVLVAGRFDGESAAAVARFESASVGSALSLIAVNRTLSDLELDAAVLAADCIVLAHSNEGPSGLMGKAAQTHTRVITAGALSLRADSHLLRDLAEWTPLAPSAIARAMENAVKSISSERDVQRDDTSAFTDRLLLE